MTIAEKTNNLRRFSEFELLKALAVIGLPLVHVMEEAVLEHFADEGLKTLEYFVFGLSAFGPSVFMICMGFGVGGGKTSPAGIRRTGIQFLLIGFFLNILRWFIPGSIQYFVRGGTTFYELFCYCLESDIYFFVGLFFVCYSFLKKWKVDSFWLLLISVMALSVNSIISPATEHIFTNQAAAAFMGNFVYVKANSCFPLLSWAIFPTIGIILGEVLKKNDEEFRKIFMKRMTVLSAVFFTAFAIFLWTYGIDVMQVLFSANNSFITDLPNVLLLISLACFMIGLMYYLCRGIANSRFMNYMMKVSTFIIPFYLLQWIFISWIFYTLIIIGIPTGSFGIMHYFITVIPVTLICLYLSTAHGMKIMRVITKVTTIKKKKRRKRE